MLTLAKLQSAVKQLEQKYVTPGKRRRFTTGLNQLALQEFTSLNAAGRNLGLNRSTGENRIRRTVTDQALADQLQRLLVSEALLPRRGYLYCSLDHSQFGPFCIAVLAVSVRRGRAIPVWCQVNASPAALMGPLLTALEQLFGALARQAPALKLVLVMDRWFAADKLFRLCAAYGIYFIARSKGDKLVTLPYDPSWWREPLGDISQAELAVTYRTHRLRFIRSDFQAGMKGDEPWLLLTNLPAPSRKGAADGLTRCQILNRYAERFEIEESFKDIKWLHRLEWQRVRTPAVIRSLLLFVFLGWWLLWRYVRPAATAHRQIRLHPKKRLSWFRELWEALQRLLRRPPLEPVPLQGRVKM